MDFGSKEGFYLMERTRLRRWTKEKESYLLKFMNVDVTGILLV